MLVIVVTNDNTDNTQQRGLLSAHALVGISV